MSKSVKRKITVELPKPRDLTKNRLSVFQRLGTKKLKSIGISESKSITDDLKQTLSAAVTITTSTTKSTKSSTDPNNVELLEDADPDILEKKREEIQKELELQMKMESRKAAAAAAMRKRKHHRSSSSSSSSSSDSDSSTSSSSTSSSSADDRRKSHKMKNKRRDSSSSSDDLHAKKLAKKRMCQKRDALKLAGKSGHTKKSTSIAVGKSKKRSLSASPPPHKKQRISAGSSTSSTVMINSRGQKVIVKSSKLLVADKHHRLREKEKEKERERLRILEKERLRSRSPKLIAKSRTPKRRTPPPSSSSSSRRMSPTKSTRYASSSRPIERHMDSRERERRDKERLDREAAREKERREALARCQERQRERERLAKEKTRGRPIEDEHPKIDRLLPRPAERAMALAAARGRSRESMERDRHGNSARSMEKELLDSYPSRGSYSEHQATYSHSSSGRRHEKESIRESERPTYDDSHGRRDDRRNEYQASAPYGDEQTPRHRGADRERRGDWMHEENYERSTDRHPNAREWDHGGGGGGGSSSSRHADNIVHGSSNRETYPDTREWIAANESNPKWDNRSKPTNWQQSESENWDRYNEESGWNEMSVHPKSVSSLSHSRGGVDKVEAAAPTGSSPSTLMSKGLVSRRWNTWRGRGRGTLHQSDFRRTNIHHHSQHTTEGYEERGDVYRRHINPQGTKSTTDASKDPQKITDTATGMSAEKPAANADEIATKKLEADDGEEIADDLSEISDEADDILNQQEEQLAASQRHRSANASTPTIHVEDKLKETPPPSSAAAVAPVTTGENKEIDEKVETIGTSTPSGDDTIDATATKATNETAQVKVKELADDIDLDFEEISDGELDEEARIKGLGDALGVDWASLVEESKAITQQKSKKIETSAKQRWQSHRILLDVGVSFKMAGALFAKNVLLNAHQKLANETQSMPTASVEPIETKDICVKMEIYDENVDDTECKPTKLNAANGHDATVASNETLKLHPVASAQAANRSSAQQQLHLVFNATGPYSRALVAKRDIAMRRQLCNLPISENNFKTVANRHTGYETIAIKLFQKSLAASV